jgi:phosphomannomutase
MIRETGLRSAAEAWVADDPDPGDRAELRALLARASGNGEDADAALTELRDRFSGRLEFGTAGLRGAVAAGPNRMNRAVVRAATAAVTGWLLGQDPADGAAEVPGGVVVGCDARHRSAEFADEAARVLAGAGIGGHLLPRPCPTPLLAFAVRHLSAQAGIMITASHNPARDNGYKLYLSDGAQIIPPVDAEIEARISRLGPLSEIPVGDLDGPLITRHGDEIAEAYLSAIAKPFPGEQPALRIVYTPMHGVARELMLRAIRAAGFTAPHVVAAQAAPDPDFPTVGFPNPEEPGALDLALADARALNAELVLASDPDGDRLAVAVPAPSAQGGADGWRMLTGDQVGALLGADLLDRTAGSPRSAERLIASTIVSSTLLSKITAAAGARYAETLTGFKWIARAGAGQPGSRFVFGYEEALGYQVGDVVRDKDGIGAALAVLRTVAARKVAGRSLIDRYDALETRHGVHLTSQLAPRVADPDEVMRRLRAAPPAALAGQPVDGITDYADAQTGLPPSDVLSYRLPGARVVIRPSGTEPKIKAYLEIVEPVTGEDLSAARQAAAARLAPLRQVVKALLTDDQPGDIEVPLL